MEPMVELVGVTKRFGNVEAVSQVHLRIQSGEFITLLGPSGCGKTTLLRLIAGFETPDSGAVRLSGEDVTHRPPYRRDVNQVFQSYALFPHLTVGENIAFGLRMKKLPAVDITARVAAVTEMVALGGLEARRPHQLSGGQRQRVALARALVCRPKVLLLDEPLSALDARLRRAMQLELKQIQKKLGITFVFVTHDQEEALTMSDRVAVIYQGRLEQLGTAREIYHRPRTAFVANFLGQANILEVRLAPPGQPPAKARLVTHDMELTVSPDELPRDAGRIFLSIRPEKVRVTRQRPSGENVFPGVVRETHFQGAHDRLKLQLESGLELTVMMDHDHAEGESAAVGAPLFCQLPSNHLVLVRDG